MPVGVRNMGHTPNNNSRWASSIAILFLTLSLLGCGGGGGSASNTASSSAAIASVVSSCSSEGGHNPYEHANDPPPYATSTCGDPSYTVSTIAGTYGAITPGSAVVNQGDSISFTITPAEGYSIQAVSGCGGSLAGNTYTTGAITADCTVTASFVSNTSGNGNAGACTPPTTSGTPWIYPCEISVAKAYNTVFLTDATGGVPYDEASREGLAALIADHASSEQQTNWTAWHSTSSIQNALSDVSNVSVLIAETSNQHTFGIKVGATLIPIYTTDTWTPPSRGWVNDPTGTPVTDPLSGQVIRDWATGITSIPDLLAANGLPTDSNFAFYVTDSAGNPITMDISNTHRIESNGTYNGGFFLAFEDDGDGDYNDLTIYVNAPHSAPGGCMGLKPTILGTPGPDFIQGTLGNDVIMTFGGDDLIYASQGKDTICSGDGHDMVSGGLGDDTIYDSSGSTYVEGGPGNDTIYTGNDADTIFGGPGNDVIYSGGGNDSIFGDAGNDIIYAGGGNDSTIGLSGNDIVHGGDGNDKIYSFVGAGTLYGEGGDDYIYGDTKTISIDGGVGVNHCSPPTGQSNTIYVNCQ